MIKNKKAILCYDAEGNFIKRYESARHTEEDGFNYKNVSQCCNNQRRIHKGHIFKFEDSSNIEKTNNIRPILCFKDNVLIKKYTTLNEILEDGFDYRGVQRCCYGEKKSHKDYVFKYEDKESLN